MKYFIIGKFTKLIGEKPQTLRRWDKDNVLKLHDVVQGGYRCYLQELVKVDD